MSKRMTALEVLFKEYVGSITSQNPAIGDTMIYMGKNPRLTSANREFQFAISEYLGKVGNAEMWKDKLITRTLLSGLLALNIMSCVQTTDAVYSEAGSFIEKTNWDESKRPLLILAFPLNGKYGIIDSNNTLYTTSDFKNYNSGIDLRSQIGSSDVKGSIKFGNQYFLRQSSSLYKTNDFQNYTQVFTGQQISSVNKIENESVKMMFFYCGREKKVHYSADATNWDAFTWEHGSIYTTDNCILSAFSATTEDKIYYRKIENGHILDEEYVTIPNDIASSLSVTAAHGTPKVFKYENGFLVMNNDVVYKVNADFITWNLISSGFMTPVDLTKVIFANGTLIYSANTNDKNWIYGISVADKTANVLNEFQRSAYFEIYNAGSLFIIDRKDNNLLYSFDCKNWEQMNSPEF